MEEPTPFKLPIPEYAPTTATAVVTLVLTFPGEFNCRHAAALAESAVKPALERDESAPPHSFGVELDERRTHQVQRLAIPKFRLRDAPVADERII